MKNSNKWKNLQLTQSHFGFTLAEVLITLGIIGVVAALTLPTLMSSYRKQVAETRLAKFYSVMNQAIEQSEVVNGPKEHWDILPSGFVKDEDGNEDKTQSAAMGWYQKYLAPYLKTSDVRVNDRIGKLMIYFPDGSLCMLHGASIQYWIEAKNFTNYEFNENGKVKNNYKASGIKYFTFMLNPWDNTNPYAYKHGMEPYIEVNNYKDENNNLIPNWNGTRENLFVNPQLGCKKTVTNERAFCTKLIQMNGWKIPKDYPLKF